LCEADKENKNEKPNHVWIIEYKDEEHHEWRPSDIAYTKDEAKDQKYYLETNGANEDAEFRIRKYVAEDK
jgi:hypothetical protein